MSERENLLLRWARLKQAVKAAEEIDGASAGSEAMAVPEAPFDPASLPSIESIAADTDIIAFLRAGVPAELTRAALRRAWTSDPAIRDFIGIAENQWDFNDPNAMPGFGPLGGADDVPALLGQALGRVDRTANTIPDLAIPNLANPPPPVPTAEIASCDDLPKQPPSEIVPAVDPAVSARDPAGEDAAAAMPSTVTAVNGDTRRANRRLHGSALPR